MEGLAMKRMNDKTLAAWFVPLLALNASLACVIVALLCRGNDAASSYRGIESIKCSEFGTLPSEQRQDIAFWVIGRAHAGASSMPVFNDRLPQLFDRVAQANPEATVDFLALSLGPEID